MRFLALLFFATLYCCKAAGIPSQNRGDLQQLIQTEIGTNATIEKNKTGTFALAYQTQNKPFEFLVIRLIDLKIVVREKINQGSVTWSSEMQIKVKQTPGIVKINSKSEDHVRLINLNNYVTKKK